MFLGKKALQQNPGMQLGFVDNRLSFTQSSLGLVPKNNMNAADNVKYVVAVLMI